MKFYTRFNVAENKNKNKIYDLHDNVDRVSYVDNTRLIQRFIMEGQNLNTVRAKALNSGLYSDAEALSENGSDVVIPVYETDPAIMKPIIDSAKESLDKSRVAIRNDEPSNDDTRSNSDLTERVADSKE